MFTPTSSIEGQCNCGAVKISIPTPQASALCHCSCCRKTSGSIFTVVFLVPTPSLTLSSEEENLTSYSNTDTDSGHLAKRVWCRTCGSHLYAEVAETPEVRYVFGGSFPPGSIPKPVYEVFNRNHEAWQSKTHFGEIGSFEGMPVKA